MIMKTLYQLNKLHVIQKHMHLIRQELDAELKESGDHSIPCLIAHTDISSAIDLITSAQLQLHSLTGVKDKPIHSNNEVKHV